MKTDDGVVSYYFFRRAASQVHISKLIPALEEGDVKLREISKQIGMTYTNLSQVMQDAHKEGLITRERVDNTWSFELTPKGRALCELCKGIKAVIEEWDEETTPLLLDKLRFVDGKRLVEEPKGSFDGVIREAKKL